MRSLFFFLGMLILALVLWTPGVFASDEDATRVKALVVKIDPAEPEAIAKLHAFIEENHLKLANPEALLTIEQTILQASGGKPGENTISVVLLTKDEPEVDPYKTKMSVDLSGEMHQGNVDFLRIYGNFNLEKNWADRHLLKVGTEIAFESDSDVARLIVSGNYDYYVTKQWALFVFSSYAHNKERAVDVDLQEYAGALYNFFSFDEVSSQYLAISAGIGHRYDKIIDGESKSDLISSYRAKYLKKITETLKVMTSLWFQHVLYAPAQNGEPHRSFDWNDYRVLYRLSFQFGAEEGLHFNLELEDEFWSIPYFNNIKKNEIGIKAGFGYTF